MCSDLRRRERGISLIEVVVFIVVVAIGVAGIATLFNQLSRGSVDPVVRQQALASATALMEEIQLRGFTYCDPDDNNVYTATSAAGCTVPEAMGPETGETRYADPRFDNVNDYGNADGVSVGFAMSGANFKDITGTALTGLSAYTASVTISQPTGSEILTSVPAAAQLKIVVTVSGPAGTTVSLQGYRLRYAPNSP